MKTMPPESTDPDLDEALRRLDPSVGVNLSLNQLISDTRLEAVPLRRARRFRTGLVFSGVAILLAGGLVAGTTLQRYLLSVSPYVGLDTGEQRSSTFIRYIPPAPESDAGKHCDLYPEFYNMTNQQLDAVATAISRDDWSTLSSDTVARAKAIDPTKWDSIYDQELKAELVDHLRSAVPGLRLPDTNVKPTTLGYPALGGYTSVCRGTW